jgi:hypothetical protein
MSWPAVSSHGDSISSYGRMVRIGKGKDRDRVEDVGRGMSDEVK